MAKTFSYGKEEKLKRQKLLEEIFSKGKTFTIYPVKIFYLQPSTPLDFPVKAGVGTSGKHFKKAVERNRIKRLLREAYRTEKVPLYEFLNATNKQVILFLLYVDKTLPVYVTLKTKMNLVISKLIKQLNEPAVENT
jgi:ribonuclease P protein component